MSDLFDRIYHLELYANWTMGHINVPFQALSLYLLLSLKYGDVIAVTATVLGTTSLLVFGWWGVERKGYLKRQTSIANKHNPEMQQLVRRRK